MMTAKNLIEALDAGIDILAFAASILELVVELLRFALAVDIDESLELLRVTDVIVFEAVTLRHKSCLLLCNLSARHVVFDEAEVEIETDEDGDAYLVLPVSGNKVRISDRGKNYVKDIKYKI